MIPTFDTSLIHVINPVVLISGENEMQSLAEGVLRVLTGREEAHEFLLPEQAGAPA